MPRIVKEYGDRAHEVVQRRPYDLTSVFGVGFHTADRIARASGVPADSPARARAAVLHVLAEAEKDGSTCLPVGELAPATAALLEGAPPTAELLAEMVDDGALVVARDDDALWAYRPPTAALEAELADRVRAAHAARAAARRPGRRRRRRPRPGPGAVGGGAGRVRARGCRSSPAARAPARRRRSG